MLKEQAENEAARQELLRQYEEHLKRQKEEEEEQKRASYAYSRKLLNDVIT